MEAAGPAWSWTDPPPAGRAAGAGDPAPAGCPQAWHARCSCCYCRPAAAHADAKPPVQICCTVHSPSLTTVSLTFALVTATGVTSIDGTFFGPLLTVPFVCRGLPAHRATTAHP